MHLFYNLKISILKHFITYYYLGKVAVIPIILIYELNLEFQNLIFDSKFYKLLPLFVSNIM